MTDVCTNQLRLKEVLGVPKLQQLWETEIGCGEVIKQQWRDVPVVDADAKDELFPSEFQGGKVE